MSRLLRKAAHAAVVLSSFFLASNAKADTIEVLAADVFNKALTEIAAAFTASTKHEVKPVFLTASVHAKAIEAGAASNVFLSANQEWMDYVATRKLIAADTQSVVVGNGVALVTPAAKPTKLDIAKGFNIAALLGADGKFAIGTPDAVPVGIYGKQSLTALGAWAAVENRLLIGKSASETRELVESGQAAAGLVFATDALNNPKLHTVGLMPADSYAPSVGPAAVLAKGDTPAARAFVAFLKSPEAQAIWKKYGFTPK
jgi:molybdate transport system substrate-binding protein